MSRAVERMRNGRGFDGAGRALTTALAPSSMSSLLLDLRFALRQLWRNPGFALTAILCLGIAMGVAATALRALDAVVLRGPDGVRDVDRLRRVYFAPNGGEVGGRFNVRTSYPVFEDLTHATGAFESFAAYWAFDASTGRGEAARLVRAAVVSPGFFRTLGVRAARGRLFQPGMTDESDGVIVSHEYWRAHLLGSEDVVGRSVVVAGRDYDVIGVAASDFTGMDGKPVDIWLHADHAAYVGFSEDLLYNRNATWVVVLARLREGVAERTARDEAASVLARAGYEAGPHPQAVELGPLNEGVGRYRTQGATVGLLVALITVVLLVIACSNVASMLTARAVARRREIAIRIALGAARARLVRQMLAESGLLIVLSLAVAGTVSTVLHILLHQMPAVPELPALAPGVIGLIGVVCVGTATLFGVAPALQALATNHESLRGGATGGRAATALRNHLVTGQVALSVTLVIAASMFADTFVRLSRVDLGFDASQVMVLAPTTDGPNESVEERRRTFRAITDALKAVPAISRISAASTAPFGTLLTVPVAVAARANVPVTEGTATLTVVDTGYFATLGMVVQSGRGVLASDTKDSERVVVVNASFARRFGHGDPLIGQCLSYPAEVAACVRIVGVVGDATQQDVGEESVPAIYAPAEQRPPGAVRVLLVRSADVSGRFPREVQQLVQRASTSGNFIDVRSLASVVESQLSRWKLGAALFLVYSGVSIALIMAGVYGLVAFMVAQRHRDLSLRLALGAAPAEVLVLVLRWTCSRVFAGIAGGVVLAAGLSELVSRHVVGIERPSMWTTAVVLLVLSACALLAGVVPARRAASTDPSTALRTP